MDKQPSHVIKLEPISKTLYANTDTMVLARQPKLITFIINIPTGWLIWTLFIPQPFNAKLVITSLSKHASVRL